MKIVRIPNPIHDVRVIDGDTIEGWIELEQVVRVKYRIRIEHIECGELPSPEGHAAAGVLMDVLAKQIDRTLHFIGSLTARDNHGRLVGDILLGDGKSLRLTLMDNHCYWPRTRYREFKSK